MTDTTTTPGPRTEAGKRLLDQARPWLLPQLEEVLAIEAEASANHEPCVKNGEIWLDRIAELEAEARADVDGPEDPASRIPYGQPCPHCGPKGHAYHADDSYGACVTCREYVPHTDAEYRAIAWPCPPARADVDGLVALRRVMEVGHAPVNYVTGKLCACAAHEDARALLAGDRAEAPEYSPAGLRYPTLEELNTGVQDPTLPMLAGDKAEAPR